MKKLTLLFVLVFIIQAITFSQPCLSEGITFTSQEEIDNFQINNPGCTEIEGDVVIDEAVPGNITNLNGLSVLTTIGEQLEILYNVSLTSLTGLDNVTSIGGHLEIRDNTDLTSLTGLHNVTYIGGFLGIYSCFSLTSLTGIDNLDSIGSIYLYDNYSLTSLTELDNVTYIQGNISIHNNDALTSLTGLENVTSIGARLLIKDNAALTSLTALDNVTFIHGTLDIASNATLTSLTGLDNVTSIGGRLEIASNATLTSLTGLDNVTSIGGSLEIRSNDALTSLTGLDNIDAGTINGINISENPVLSTCDVQSICDYLANNNDTIIIFDNANGCHNQQVVEEACELVDIYDNIHEIEISIYPNPAIDKLSISSKNGLKIETVNIYNQLGQKVLQINEIRENIDISTLGQGIYIIELKSNEWKIREKLIIKK